MADAQPEMIGNVDRRPVLVSQRDSSQIKFINTWKRITDLPPLQMNNSITVTDTKLISGEDPFDSELVDPAVTNERASVNFIFGRFF